MTNGFTDDGANGCRSASGAAGAGSQVPARRSQIVSTGPRFTGVADAWWARCVRGVMAARSSHSGRRTGAVVCTSACQVFDTTAQATAVVKPAPVRATRGKVTTAVTGSQDWRQARERS